ncbi:MAG: aminoacyl-tRNA hydrolase, partial [Anaerolineae bacterium]|nr:aminoacyl-tRNA hydrolase [Anaerolineae bacterium]
GHNGMKSIANHLGQGFPRLRLGIGRPPGRMDPAAYVLQDFSAAEKAVLDDLLDAAREATETFLQDGIELAMSRHNGTIGEDDKVV